jgi:hypothetical protein
MKQLKSRPGILAFVFALILGVIIGGTAVAETQVHMKSARTDLQSAVDQLNSATADKGGHRNKAIDLTKQAMGEVDAGIQAGAQ